MITCPTCKKTYDVSHPDAFAAYLDHKCFSILDLPSEPEEEPKNQQQVKDAQKYRAACKVKMTCACGYVAMIDPWRTKKYTDTRPYRCHPCAARRQHGEPSV